MKIFTNKAFLVLCCLTFLSATLIAQEKPEFEKIEEVEEFDYSQFEGTPEVMQIAPPPDTTNMPAVTNNIWYANNGSDRYIWLD